MAIQDSVIESSEDLENDVCFILTSAFLIFTMQTGYGLLESGTVSRKNEVNILLKNAVNISCGSIAFWAFGFAFSSDHTIDVDVELITRLNITSPTSGPSRGKSSKNMMTTTEAPMIQESGWSKFSDFVLDNLVTPERFFLYMADHQFIGTTYAEMAFQLAYATTCTAIISGAMAERCRFMSYFVFCFVANILFCLPARWTMFNGWLNRAGAIDIGGSGTVHLVGGCAGLVAAILLGPRLGRFNEEFRQVPMGHPTNVVHGIILLWWGWLGYSAGSCFGIAGDKWAYAARSSVVTILASMSGGAFGMLWSAFANGGLQEIHILSYSILASLVSISGGAAVISPLHSTFVGVIGAALCLLTAPLIERLRIDDPTGSFAVHAIGGAWGLLATAFFAERDSVVHYRKNYEVNITVTQAEIDQVNETILYGQLLALGVLVAWSIAASLVILLPIQAIFGLRMTTQEEILGSDFVEHGIIHDGNKQLLKIVKQKIGLVVEGGMSEIQASAEVARRFAEAERNKNLRKRSLTTGRISNAASSRGTPASSSQDKSQRGMSQGGLSVHDLLTREQYKRQNQRYYLGNASKGTENIREFVDSHQPQPRVMRPNTSVGEQTPSMWTVYRDANRSRTPESSFRSYSRQTMSHLPTVEDI